MRDADRGARRGWSTTPRVLSRVCGARAQLRHGLVLGGRALGAKLGSREKLSDRARSSALGRSRGDAAAWRACDIVDSMSFSRAEVAALSREIDASSSLLRHGFAILAEYRFASREAEPVFASLAGGAEKLLKLSFGLATVDEGGGWPKKRRCSMPATSSSSSTRGCASFWPRGKAAAPPPDSSRGCWT